MSLPEKNDVDALVQKLVAAANGYTNAPDVDGRIARLDIVDAAKQLIRSVSEPEMTPINHGMNVSCRILESNLSAAKGAVMS